MKKLPLFTILLIVSGCAYFMKSYTWKGNNWKDTLNEYDTRAYYSYLPAIFVKHDLTITDSTLHYTNVVGKRIFNKHFIGPAVLWSPFFLATLEYSKMRYGFADTNSVLFVKGIGIAALFWLFTGLYCLWKTLKYFNISGSVIALTLFLLFFGTNLFYYSFQQYMMAHLYSFSMLSVFLYAGIIYSASGRKIYLVLASMAFALSVIIRPTSVCILPLLLPLMCDGIPKTIRVFFNRKSLLIGLSVVLPILFLQSLAWYLQTGRWLVRAYSGEGFYFLHPQLFNVLFSFQNGWFIYSPLALVSLFGFSGLYRANKVAFYSSIAVIATWIYLVASWWCWAYQAGFGHRAFIDIYPVVAIGMAHLFSSVQNRMYALFHLFGKKIIMGSLLLLCGLLLSLNLVQTYQYCHDILLSDWTDWESYKYVFLKTSDKYCNCLGGCRDLQPYSSKPPRLVFSSVLNAANLAPEWKCKSPEMLNGKPVIHFKGDDFGVCLVAPSDSLYNKDARYYSKVILTRFEPEGNCSSGVLFIHDITAINGSHEYYKSFMINECPMGRDSNTRTYYYDLETPGLMRKDSKMTFYIWNQKLQDFYLTGLSVEIYRCFP